MKRTISVLLAACTCAALLCGCNGGARQLFLNSRADNPPSSGGAKQDPADHTKPQPTDPTNPAEPQQTDPTKPTEPQPTNPQQPSNVPWKYMYEYRIQNAEYDGTYCLYDINRDGTPELFLQTGPAGNSMTLEVYSCIDTLESAYSKLIDSWYVGYWNASVCPITDDGFLLQYTRMGWETLTLITWGGWGENLSEQTLFSGEVPTLHDTVKLTMYALDDLSGLKWQENALSAEEAHNQAIIDSLSNQSVGGTGKREDAIRLFQTTTKTYWNGYTFADLEEIVFANYEIQCEPYQGSDTQFLVTLSGNYYPNVVDLPSVQKYGQITLLVDTDTGGVSLVEDDGIERAFEVYISLGTSWY